MATSTMAYLKYLTEFQQSIWMMELNRLEKILQVTNFRKNIFDSKDQKNINKKLYQNLINKNLIICDFGVGLFEDIVLKKINKNKNIYLNVQTNSLNHDLKNLFEHSNKYSYFC